MTARNERRADVKRQLAVVRGALLAAQRDGTPAECGEIRAAIRRLEDELAALKPGRPPITVYIDADPDSLGAGSTQDELDSYTQNLADHLCARFSVSIHVEPVIGGKRAGSKCPEREDIDEYVTELEAGDGWLALLDERP